MSGFDITASIIGQQDAIENLDRMRREFPKESAGALYRRGEAIIADAKEHYVPVDQGALRDSGHVELPDITEDEITVVIGFGGATVDYAFVQHEALDYQHTVGEAKYLEKPLLAAADSMAADIAADLAGVIGG